MTEGGHQPLHILERGLDWVAVAKPPRLVVHRGEGTRQEYAALQRLRDQLGAPVYPLHRLDRQASGVLIFSTRQEATGALHAALTAAGSQKVYLALVRGAFEREGPVVVESPMKDDNGLWKEARSEVEVLGSSREPRCSLLRVRPDTGRYHQVRRHVRDLSHPILGDGEHGDSRVNRWWREEHGLRRLALHAVSVTWAPPGGGVIRVVCPLFKDHGKLLRRMPWWDSAAAREPALSLPPLPMLDAPPAEVEDVP